MNNEKLKDFVIYDGVLDDKILDIAPNLNAFDGGYIMFIGLTNATSRLVGTSTPYRRLMGLVRQFEQFGVSIERVVVTAPSANYLQGRQRIATALEKSTAGKGDLGQLDRVLEMVQPALSKLFENKGSACI